MNSTKRILAILVCLFMYAPVIAQEPQPAAPSKDAISPDSHGTEKNKKPGVGPPLFRVNHDSTLQGDGTTASPLGVANGGVTGSKIAAGQVVKSLNGMADNVTLSPGANITITPFGNSLSIAAPNVLGSVARDGTLVGNGTGAAPLGLAVPLSLSGSSSPGPILSVENNGPGDGVRAIAGGTTDIGRGGGIGVVALGGESNFFGGPGVNAVGGQSVDGFGGFGVNATGGRGVNFSGGGGLRGNGGSSANGSGGAGVIANGGPSGVGRGGNGISAFAGRGPAGDGLAGEFNGNVAVFGTLSKSAGSFKIDHPLDPANKYLSHSFVESPDMMNVYNGNIVTDRNGEAIVTLPDYFEALNRDFRYQLTVIGQFAQAIVANEVRGNRFTIKTDRPGVKVSWQVTGVRQDEYANKHRIPVEEVKPERERGYFLTPEVFSQPEEKSVEWARNPELMREIKSRPKSAEIQRREK